MVAIVLSTRYGSVTLVEAALALPGLLAMAFVGNVLPDYLALRLTRSAVSQMRKSASTFRHVLIIVKISTATAFIAGVGCIVGVCIVSYLSYLSHTPPSFMRGVALTIPGIWMTSVPYEVVNRHYSLLWILPAFFTSIWLWLYAGSGFILKAASRFDIGFDWFNRHFDIETRPLQSIGLIAGALVAVVYWTAVIVGRFL